MRFICPRCQKIVIAEERTEDFIHNCDSGNAVLDNEDIVVLGEWGDYTGSGTELNTNMRGSENELFGTRAEIEDGDEEEVTKRGNRLNTHRTRQHLEYIDLRK